MPKKCGRWGCDITGDYITFYKPMCRAHWQEWDDWELEECNRCHWFFGEGFESIIYDEGEWASEFPFLCNECLGTLLIEDNRPLPWAGTRLPENRPINTHSSLDRRARYVYIMKLDDGSYYPGQTTNLPVRYQEHRDGQQHQTSGKSPKLVYYEYFKGRRSEVNEAEDSFILLNQTPVGRRKIRQLIEEFREPLRLLDLEA